MILVEDTYGHGALPLKRDLRDTKYGKIAMATPPFNWTVGFDAEHGATSPIKDQGQSSSCGGQSGAYLEALTKTLFSERSAKYIYSQIYYPQGGTTLRDILKLLVNKGSASEAIVPSYQAGKAPTESFMRNRDLNSTGDASAVPYVASGYAFVEPNIEAYAEAIRDNGGAIMQLNGQNNGTWLSVEPIGPSNSINLWSHFLVCTGAMMKNGKKAIKIKNSWGPGVGENGYQYIDEDYFKTGNVLQGGVIYPKDSAIIVQQKITLITRLIALYQQLINKIGKIGSIIGSVLL